MKKNIITTIALAAITAMACTDDHINTARTPIEIGGITVVATAAQQQTRADQPANLFFKEADQITVTATGTPAYTAPYTYAAATNTWTPAATPIYLEDVYANQAPTHTFNIDFGQPQANQTTEALLHQADRVEGPATLNVDVRPPTLTAQKLSRRHTLVEVTIVQGIDWANEAAFLASLAAYNCTFISKSGEDITPYRPGTTTFKVIVPPSELPEDNDVLFILTKQGDKDLICRINYGQGVVPTAGTRLTVEVKMNNHNGGNLEAPTFTIADWQIGDEGKTLPGEV
ncbi:fimbrillin family protein [Bacteroides sp. OttesenSCG-928-J23]|nr:fimbrillin family protein [Bacteroides sp. OttesenSCG-928-J23]